ncbi:S-adenosyl-l-methionine hydroxide adenosyltransferase family protein [Actinomyces sp. zg-332]|uniref:SAM hydrolase/SAM-dependent halogenase family protein n=1 Tax=Actinomyces sp. zg-332 TaxID=2708340 RepID=UPI0014225078|nr:S-adenosyl-l-methionine hydroxide adenosyltransferase family protein [Actinomyces sp. zg-332]QPK93947.1 S-adenosyl-l-methionine hydroxide adenosyltransferase family protein [Actinomyces sp. zg-332]
MNALVLQSDFGYSDGAVSAMQGVAFGVDKNLPIFTLTHDIPPYDVWEASYRLTQTLGYWPEGTVFVSVVDPGVGSDRASVVAKTVKGQYVVTPDNGTLTHLHKTIGLESVRVIDEEKNRLPGSGHSYTFHGRDIYAFTGARLAAGIIDYEGVGPLVEPFEIVELETVEPKIEQGKLTGTIDALDVRYGSLWTNIPRLAAIEAGIEYGDLIQIQINNNTNPIHTSNLKYVHSFAEVHVGESLMYVNSLDNLAIAINRGSFSRAFQVEHGPSWNISITKL